MKQMSKRSSQLNIHIPIEHSKDVTRAYRVISAHAAERGIGRGEYVSRLLLREAARIEKDRKSKANS